VQLEQRAQSLDQQEQLVQSEQRAQLVQREQRVRQAQSLDQRERREQRAQLLDQQEQLEQLARKVLLVQLEQRVPKVLRDRLAHKVNRLRSTTTRLKRLLRLVTQRVHSFLTTTLRKLLQRNYKFHTLTKMDMTLTSSLLLSRLTMFFTSKMQTIQTTTKNSM
jgi:hypothetical protein